MIQDIAPWRLRNEFMNAAPRPGDLVLDMSGEGVLSRIRGRYVAS